MAPCRTTNLASNLAARPASARSGRRRSTIGPRSSVQRAGRRPALGGTIALLVAVVLCGCAPSPEAPPAAAAVDPETTDGEVRMLLDQWVDAFETRDPASVEKVLSDAPSFVWLEDGEVRYPTRDAILAALASFPEDLAARYELDEIVVRPVETGHAWVRMTTRTEIEQGGEIVSSFDGVVTMLVERASSGWRIAAAHTSNRRAR